MNKNYLRKVLSNILWLIFDKVFLLIINLVVLVKIANHYGASEYGIYQYAVSVNTLLAIILGFIDSRVVKKKYTSYSVIDTVYNVTIAKCILSIVYLVVGGIFSRIVNRGLHFQIIFFFALFNNIIMNLGFGIENHFEYELKSKNIVISANIAKIISCLLQLMAIKNDWSIEMISVIIFIGSVIRLCLLVAQYRMKFSQAFIGTLNLHYIQGLIKESLPLGIAAAAAIIYTRCDVIMIESLMKSYSNVGIYSISNQLISVVQIILVPVQVSIFPKMIEWYKKGEKVYYSYYLWITSIMTWIYIIGVVFSYIVLPFIFCNFFSKDYMQSYSVFQIHILGTFFMYNAILRSSHFTLTGHTYVMMISQIIAVFFNIILNLLLIPRMGIYGAALSTVITQCVSLFVSNFFFKEGKMIGYIQLRGVSPRYLWYRKE
ncbi:flippase [Enterocloster aldenensis]|uniref:flippase n=1 Tax=Enterocloster aldenensis TaxID=358742 RepID=UPI003510FBB6